MSNTCDISAIFINITKPPPSTIPNRAKVLYTGSSSTNSQNFVLWAEPSVGDLVGFGPDPDPTTKGIPDPDPVQILIRSKTGSGSILEYVSDYYLHLHNVL